MTAGTPRNQLTRQIPEGDGMDKTVLEIEKGEDLIRLVLKEFKGRQYVDARVFYMSETGEWMPTKKGLSMTPEIAAKIAEGITDALKELGAKPAVEEKAAAPKRTRAAKADPDY